MRSISQPGKKAGISLRRLAEMIQQFSPELH